MPHDTTDATDSSRVPVAAITRLPTNMASSTRYRLGVFYRICSFKLLGSTGTGMLFLIVFANDLFLLGHY